MPPLLIVAIADAPFRRALVPDFLSATLFRRHQETNATVAIVNIRVSISKDGRSASGKSRSNDDREKCENAFTRCEKTLEASRPRLSPVTPPLEAAQLASMAPEAATIVVSNHSSADDQIANVAAAATRPSSVEAASSTAVATLHNCNESVSLSPRLNTQILSSKSVEKNGVCELEI